MDKIRMAIVGPADSVLLAYEVALERDTVLAPQSIVYQDAAEVADIISKHKDEFDMWLFSGIVPYQHALKADVDKPLFYIPHTGSSLYRALFEITYIEKRELRCISFDTFSAEEVEETFHDINLTLPKIYVKHYEGAVSAQDITKYHYDLWQQGKTDIAVTCFLATYEKLKKLGVPVVRIWPTRSNIRTTLDVAINAVIAQRFKGSQLAVLEIAISKYDDIVRASSSYDVKRIELCLYQILVGFAEVLEGSLVLRGDGQYTLYTTRGVLEKSTQELTVMPIFEEITCRVKAAVNGGIGFGQTAYAAEQNAFHALGLAEQKGQGIWMAVNDKREVYGPLSSAVHLKYSVTADYEASRRFADKVKLSTTTVNRLLAVLDKLDNTIIGADELAVYLGITTRSARRILAALAEEGFAKIAGEEMLVKGRPRKLYEVLVPQLITSIS